MKTLRIIEAIGDWLLLFFLIAPVMAVLAGGILMITEG